MMRRAFQRISRVIYTLLLRAYPARDRAMFGEPMLAAFDERCAEQAHGVVSAARIWLHEFPSPAVTLSAD